MESDDLVPHHEDPPQIPAFFTPDDLPAWLRGDAAPAPHHDGAPQSQRARAAWATNAGTPSPNSGSVFQAAAGATWALLSPHPRSEKRGRRARAIQSRIPTLTFVLALVSGWLAVRR